MLERRRAGKPFTFYHYMIDLTGGPCIYKRISGCGSGTEYMAVTPWGDLYPCHQFVGEEKFKLGDVWTGVTNTETQAEFAACNVYAARGVPRPLGTPVLLRRLRGERLPRDWFGARRMNRAASSSKSAWRRDHARGLEGP